MAVAAIPATPTLHETDRVCPSICMGLRMEAISRLLMAASSSSRKSVTWRDDDELSPPRRLTVSVRARPLTRRRVTWRSRPSPMWWPRVSLMALKPRSMNSTAICLARVVRDRWASFRALLRHSASGSGQLGQHIVLGQPDALFLRLAVGDVDGDADGGDHRLLGPCSRTADTMSRAGWDPAELAAVAHSPCQPSLVGHLCSTATLAFEQLGCQVDPITS